MSLKETAKLIAFRYTPFGAPQYSFSVEPIELAFLINELEKLKAAEGNIAEVGVARGMTTRFLSEHIVSQKLGSTLTLYAIDTFSSFTKRDLDFEIANRNKEKYLSALKSFEYNDFEVWKRNFSQFPFVKSIKADCVQVDFKKIAPLKLSFLDVDLYLPTKVTLPKLYEATISGGTIMVDDVLNNNIYDGAYQAYMEFCHERKIAPEVIGNKCGIIHKE